MVLTEEVKHSIATSVLCWLATCDSNGRPNVSPKEVFTYVGDEIIIANIASPVSEKNILGNPHVCVSFVDILIQKGYKVEGDALIIGAGAWERYIHKLEEITKGVFPIKNIFKITPTQVSPIVAPSYFVMPEESIEVKIQKAKKAYSID